MNRSELELRFQRLYSDVESILFQLDPVGINCGCNTNEYAPEVDTIIPRLKPHHQICDVRQIIYEEFVRWFDDDAGEISDAIYQLASEKIWQAWMKYRNPRSR